MAVPLERATKGNSSAPQDAAAADTRERATGLYYDRLSRWTALLTSVGYGGGRGTLTAHRALADPRAGGQPTFTRLHDVVAAALPAPLDGRILDAGCGLGGTMLDLAARGNATFTGLTLSAAQAEIGRRAIAKAGLAARIEIRTQSYDSPPEGPFDAAIAVESLAHSPHPAASIAAIAGRLAAGGRLVIVDDMPEPAARGTRDLARFQAGWRLPALLGPREVDAALTACGLAIVAACDLSAEVEPRALAAIARLEKVNRALRLVAPSTGVRAMLDSYHGGLALERLYQGALMRYRLVVGEKPM